MGVGVFGIGISGMNAAQAGLITTGHNISNASTPGYSRQEVVQTANIAQTRGTGFLGQGVNVVTVRRLYSEALSGQLSLAQTQGGQFDAYNVQIKQLSNMFSDPSAGLAPVLSNFFSGVAEVAAHPESVPSRQALLSAANTLTTRLRDLDQQMSQMNTSINADITTSVNSINGYAQQVAALNLRIASTEGASGQAANDLRDQRDAVVTALNQEVHTSVIKDNSGDYNLFIGNGQSLVVGSRVFELAATPSAEHPDRIVVGYKSGNSIAALAESSLQGGRLGGELSFRSASLDGAQNALGRLAVGVAQSFNAQHRLGQDLNGALGGDFFSFTGPTVLPNSGNLGSADVTATLQDASALTTSSYSLKYTGSSGGNENFELTRDSDGTTWLATPFVVGTSGTITKDGLTLTLPSGATAKDSWTIEPTRLASGSIQVTLKSPQEIAAASPIRTQALVANRSSATLSLEGFAPNAILPISLSYDPVIDPVTNTVTGSIITVLGTTDSIPYTAGVPISYHGVTFSISGQPQYYDRFTIERNSNGVSDNRNALALAALQTANTLGKNANIAGGQASTTFAGAYSEMVSQIGNTARQIDMTATAQVNVIAQAKQSLQSLSGVNLDEEAANLLRFQQAYQASGKMMQIANSLFQSVLDLAR